MEDEKIVDLYWERFETAITETSKKYGRYCTKIAFNILANDEDAEESVNDTYLAAWNTMPPSRPNKLSAFLGRITRNIALDKYDYYKAKKRSNEFDLILSELGDCVSAPDNVEADYEAGEAAKNISLFLHGLDTGNRHIFIRRYWYSDSILELAERFDMSESKVKSMLFRTRNKLKKYLEKEDIMV